MVVSTSAAAVATIACLGLVTAAHAQRATAPDSLPTASSSVEMPIALPRATEVVDIDKAREAAAAPTGGLTAAGDLTRAYIERRTRGGDPKRIPLDLEALLVRRDFSQDRPIQVGDQIVIPTARRSVLVEGAVTRAGSYEFNPQFGIAEYISNAGGRTRTARELTDIMLIHPSGVVVPYRGDTVVAPGDTIVVPERNFSRPEIVQIAVASASLAISALWIGDSISRGH